MSDNPVNDFNNEIDSTSGAAYQAQRGGDEKWKSLLESYGAKALSAEEHDALLNSSMKIARGAFPIELRRVYECIIVKYSAAAASSPALAAALNNFQMDKHVLDYYQKIKPFTGMNDIFKNASVGTAKYSEGLKGEKQLTIKCKNCGAPRLEEMQYDKCLFCGSELFEKAG